MFDFRINVAGTVIEFRSDEPEVSYGASDDARFAGFEYVGDDRPDVKFRIAGDKESPDLSGDKKLLFSVEGNWQLYRVGEKLVYEYPDRKTGVVERLTVISQDMKEGVIYNLKRNARGNLRETGKQMMSEVKANFFQIFLLDYLIRYKIGILAHGVTMDDNGKGLIFMGKSGAGKSTLASIFAKNDGVKIYNDDRAILKHENGETIFYNAPWTGAYVEGYHPRYSDTFKLDKIFFIYHEKENKIRKLSSQEGAVALVRNTFPAFWHQEGFMDAFSLCVSIAKRVPCFELGFVNDSKVVEFVRENS